MLRKQLKKLSDDKLKRTKLKEALPPKPKNLARKLIVKNQIKINSV